MIATKKGAQHCNAEAPKTIHELPAQYGDFTTSEQNAQGEIKDRFQPKKEYAMQLATVLDDFGLDGRANRMCHCGDWLTFELTEEKHKLVGANFCRDRLCPMCNWRRSLKIFGQVSKVLDSLQGQYQYIFLTLTVRNCHSDELADTLDVMQKGWHNLTKQKRFKVAVAGTFRAIEITHRRFDDYHPHYHVVLAVKRSYFKKGYIPQAEWSAMWMRACGLDYNPVCDVRKVKGKEKAVAEVSKYAVKGSDILRGDRVEVNSTVRVLLESLTGRRLCSFTGVLREARRQLRLDDIENGDFVHVDSDEMRDDVASLIVHYRWYCGVYLASKV